MNGGQAEPVGRVASSADVLRVLEAWLGRGDGGGKAVAVLPAAARQRGRGHLGGEITIDLSIDLACFLLAYLMFRPFFSLFFFWAVKGRFGVDRGESDRGYPVVDDGLA